jgi:hypothetical protein
MLFALRKRRARTLLASGCGALLALATITAVRLFAADSPQNGSTSMSTSESGDRVATMDTATKANAFRENDGLRTGPKIGEKVPDFTLPDQHGKQLSLHDLMGPKGLLLVFLRSADW